MIIWPANFNSNTHPFNFSTPASCNFASPHSLTKPKNFPITLDSRDYNAAPHLAIECFECNYIKLGQDKWHLLISGHKYESVWANVGSWKIWESNDQKFLEYKIDNNLKFNHYMLKQHKKASRKLSELTQIFKFMGLERRRVLIKSFAEYCLLVCMWVVVVLFSKTIKKRNSKKFL